MAPWRSILHRQGQQLLLQALLVALVLQVAARAGATVTSGAWLGLDARTWLVLSLAGPLLHQGYVWFAWRTELHLRLGSRVLGERALAVHALLFALLSLGRLSLVGLAVANAGTLPGRAGAWRLAGVALLVPCAWLFHSVARHFGFVRATGADHFDPAWREPLVRRGLFRLSPNAMYVFGFLGMWAIAFLGASAGATLAAAFAHASIWVHWWCTERPDLELLYGRPTA